MADQRKLITLTTVIRKYKLTRDEATSLPYIEARNPYYRRAPAMLLFDEEEIIQLANRIDKIRLENKTTKKEQAQEKKDKERAKAIQTLKQIKNQQTSKENVQAGNTQLPICIWAKILVNIGDSYEPHGIVGVGVVVENIARAALVCRDLRLAVREVWPQLAIHLNTLKTINYNWPLFDKALCTPSSLTIVELKSLLKILECKVSGVKAELVMRVLHKFGCSKASTIPARILWELQNDKVMNRNTNWYHRLKRDAYYVISRMEPFDSIYIGQKHLYSMFDSEQEMIEASDRVYERLQNEQALIQQQRYEAKKDILCCECKSNLKAPTCSKSMCRRCCTDPTCKRHSSR